MLRLDQYLGLGVDDMMATLPPWGGFGYLLLIALAVAGQCVPPSPRESSACPAKQKGDYLLQMQSKKQSKSVVMEAAPSLRTRVQMPVTVQIAPGNPATLNNNPVHCGYTASERHSVRCCSDSGQKVKMWQYGCTGSCSTCKSATYLEAVDVCESAGYRLCSLDEALGPQPYDCGTSQWCSTGCNMNGEMFWTTTTCQGECPPQPPPNFQPWSQLDYSSSQQCDPNDAHHCFGNGDCVCGTCICRLGWRGPYCSQLDLLPARRSAPGLPMNSPNPTWGGAAVLEGGQVKFLAGGKRLKATEAPFDPRTYWGRSPAYNETALASGGDPYQGQDPWSYTVDSVLNPFTGTNFKEADPAKEKYESRSYLSLYESATADFGGPYTESVPKWFKTFRADLKKSADGSLLLLSNANGGFTIMRSASGQIGGAWTDKAGQAIDAKWAGATPGSEPDAFTPMPPPVYHFRDNGHCGKASSGSLAGTYVTGTGSATRACTQAEMDSWSCHLADPTFAIHPDGTAVILFRGTKCDSTDHKERLGLLVSPTGWQGPYSLQQEPILGDAEVQDGGLEDLFMWIDHRGTHVVVHSQATDHSYDPSQSDAGFNHKKKRGAYLFSADGFDRWSLSDWELFPSEIRWDDGVTQFLLKQQRPSIIFDHLMQPQYLVTGVDYLYDPCCDWYPFGSAWTLVQPIMTACPAGQRSIDSSCAACPTDAPEYSGRCTRATTKYGECVCAACSKGYRGDHCEVETVVCQPFQTSMQCQNMSGSAKWLGREVVDNGECLSACQEEADLKDTEGCCFKYWGDENRNCRFFPAQQPVIVSSDTKGAAMCSRR